MTGGADRAIRSILVAGAGIVGLSAAIAFARALPGARISLLELPPDPAALADRMPGTLPAAGRFHAAIGLDELTLVRDGIATHRLGTRFEQWSADGAPWIHAFGDYGRRAGPAPFHQIWTRARQEGRALPFDRYSAAAALAAAQKFVHPSQDSRSVLSAHLYALRLDPELYRERLSAQAAPLPIARVTGGTRGVERRGDGGVAAMLLGDGRRLEADLFIDCAGPSAPLLSAVDGRFEDWGAFLPCDRLAFDPPSPGAGPASCDLAAATAAGWRWEKRLPDRVLRGRAFASEPGGPEDAGETVAIRPGRRPEPWVRNVLALGDAAVAVDPLEDVNLHLAQTGILRALALLPGRDCHPLELREYNRQMGQEATRIRDFLALHFLRKTPNLAERASPESLAHTLEQFERRGRLPFYEEEAFDRHSWLAVLLGLGVMPLAPDPAAAGVDADEAAAAMARLADDIAAAVAKAPPYRDYLARMTAQSRRPAVRAAPRPPA